MVGACSEEDLIVVCREVETIEGTAENSSSDINITKVHCNLHRVDLRMPSVKLCALKLSTYSYSGILACLSKRS